MSAKDYVGTSRCRPLQPSVAGSTLTANKRQERDVLRQPVGAPHVRGEVSLDTAGAKRSQNPGHMDNNESFKSTCRFFCYNNF